MNDNIRMPPAGSQVRGLCPLSVARSRPKASYPGCPGARPAGRGPASGKSPAEHHSSAPWTSPTSSPTSSPPAACLRATAAALGTAGCACKRRHHHHLILPCRLAPSYRLKRRSERWCRKRRRATCSPRRGGRTTTSTTRWMRVRRLPFVAVLPTHVSCTGPGRGDIRASEQAGHVARVGGSVRRQHVAVVGGSVRRQRGARGCAWGLMGAVQAAGGCCRMPGCQWLG